MRFTARTYDRAGTQHDLSIDAPTAEAAADAAEKYTIPNGGIVDKVFVPPPFLRVDDDGLITILTTEGYRPMLDGGQWEEVPNA